MVVLVSTSEQPFKGCPDCGVLRPRSDYYPDRNTKDGLYYICKPCTLAKRKEHHASEANLKDHARRLMACVRSSVRRRGIECSIDLAWARERLEGVTHCELTGWPIDMGPRKLGGIGMNPFAPSFDRIDNSVGYHSPNIRVTPAFVNHLMGAYSDEDMRPAIEALRAVKHG